ncbi:MAG TPA: hypothetical protein VJT83_08470, partial [Chitinophagaceae bacterium]|nr:hypothetical protein [Chitinophagaceae bacterium]
MKKLLPILALILFAQAVYARHIKGGEITYTYVGPGSNGSDRYIITLRLFLSCDASGTQLDESVNLSIYQRNTNIPIPGSPFTVPLTGDQFINLSDPNPCIVNPSPVCYRLRTYDIAIDIPKTPQGHSIIFQRCCRIDGIRNLSPNSSIGSSYVTDIHGTDAVGDSTNSSPYFVVKDTVLICQNRPFTLDFGASDNDGDSLSYEFCDAYTCPSSPPTITNPPPPYLVGFVGYAPGFSGTQPLGSSVTINPKTGLIQGIAPSGGNYVVCVCVTEWRKGKQLSTHRKDFNVQIDDKCDFASAQLKPSYITCDGFDFTFQNEAPYTPLVHTYYWDFGIATRSDDTSTQAAPLFTFPDSGLYRVKLFINKDEDCPDSAETQMKVYPGFFAGFIFNGACKDFPFQFTDTTKTKYGTVSNWEWIFGDETTFADTSTQKNPQWKYTTSGLKSGQLIVGSSKGCIDTVQKEILVYDKPPITLPFRDTLICSIDTLMLQAAGLGNFSWGPIYNIFNQNSATPSVYPKTTTNYVVTLDDRGCINKDTIKVRVVDSVTLTAKPDSVICLTDSITLHAIGDGLKFTWSPSATLDDPGKSDPIAIPTGTTTYTVMARIGKCNKTDQIFVKTVPYPSANAGPDTTICYEDTAQLHGTMTAYRFNWSPANTLINSASLNPLAFPSKSTYYILTVTDTLGCPKPFRDSMLLTVR